MNKNKHINLSGFPLQIGLAHAIDNSRNEHGWKVLHIEHGWHHENTHESGFIDIIVEDGDRSIVLNIECKRLQDAIWQFLLPKPKDQLVNNCKCWKSSLSKSISETFDWVDVAIKPISYESQFCVVAGQDDKARPMLERIAATVVTSTEAFALEEAKLLEERPIKKTRAYINVITTNAKLEACKFDPMDIDLENGKIDKAEYESISCIRFRKQLSPNFLLPNSQVGQNDFKSIAQAKENTVLIVEACKFIDFLIELKVYNL